MKNKVFILIVISVLTSYTAFPQGEEQLWVDSVYNSLTLEQRVGQLINIRVNQPNQKPLATVESDVRGYNVGGMTFFRMNADEQVAYTNKFQSEAQTPMLVAIDAEWGLGMRVNKSVSYPYQMTLGAMDSDLPLQVMGSQVAQQCRRMGIHINFAPCVDVNNNPANPVIGMRSFGENPRAVANKAEAYMRGMQQGGLLTSIKHFPGHGNTTTDSHASLPTVYSSKKDVDNVELYPFRTLIERGATGVMVGHLYLPAIEPVPNTSSSLSKNIITDLLKDELGFDGLIYTDALDMKGASQYISQDSLALYALMAGADVLLMPSNVSASIGIIVEAARSDAKVMERIAESCRKVLTYKYRVGLNNYQPVSEKNVLSDIKKYEYQELVQQMLNQAQTMLVNKGGILPLNLEKNKRVAVVTIGEPKTDMMRKELQSLGFIVKEYNVDKKNISAESSRLISSVGDADVVVVNIRQTSINASSNYGINKETVEFVRDVQRKNKVILNVFASPYAADLFKIGRNVKSVIVAYEDRAEAEIAVSRILVGKLNPTGHLPVSVGNRFPTGSGLKFGRFEESDAVDYVPVNYIHNAYTDMIDSVAVNGIRIGAYPGCQIFAMKDGTIIYDKCFGSFTYDSVREVQQTDLYDIASLTKVFASGLAIMKLYEDSLVRLDDKLSDYFPYLRRSNKADITLMELFTHQSGMPDWIPIHLETLDTVKYKDLYSNHIDETHTLRVAENLYIDEDFRHVIFDTIRNSCLREKKYKYSDLGFYFIPELVEMLTNSSFEDYLDNSFYKPMHLSTITYCPLNRFTREVIAPTENDTVFRHQLLCGDVHDQTCALMGGVSGHAGLFSNARDLGLIMQMLVDGGEIDGMQLLNPETIKLFTTTAFPENGNRRAIVFDKPPLEPDASYRTPSASSSSESFGHTGFTGTFAWADPQNQLVVIFLSNRVCPDMNNNKLSKLDIRTKIHDLFYEAVK